MKTQAAEKKSEGKRDNSDRQKTAPEPSRHLSPPVGSALFLQRSIGNQALQHLVNSRTIQAKLNINQPGDFYEQEADRIAEQLMTQSHGIGEQATEKRASGGQGQTAEIQRTPLPITPLVQRRKNEEEREFTDGIGLSLESTIHSLRGGGYALDLATRSYFESRFGHDFSSVRIHTTSQAADVARSINAKAFTHGSDIFFGAGQYSSDSAEGKKLLGHELTHVVQQQGGGRSDQLQLKPNDENKLYIDPPSLMLELKKIERDIEINGPKRLADVYEVIAAVFEIVSGESGIDVVSYQLEIFKEKNKIPTDRGDMIDSQTIQALIYYLILKENIPEVSVDGFDALSTEELIERLEMTRRWLAEHSEIHRLYPEQKYNFRKLTELIAKKINDVEFPYSVSKSIAEPLVDVKAASEAIENQKKTLVMGEYKGHAYTMTEFEAYDFKRKIALSEAMEMLETLVSSPSAAVGTYFYKDPKIIKLIANLGGLFASAGGGKNQGHATQQDWYKNLYPHFGYLIPPRSEVSPIRVVPSRLEKLAKPATGPVDDSLTPMTNTEVSTLQEVRVLGGGTKATEEAANVKEPLLETPDTTLSGQRREPESSSTTGENKPVTIQIPSRDGSLVLTIKIGRPGGDLPIVPKKGFPCLGKQTPMRLSLWDEPLPILGPMPAGLRPEPIIHPDDLRATPEELRLREPLWAQERPQMPEGLHPEEPLWTQERPLMPPSDLGKQTPMRVSRWQKLLQRILERPISQGALVEPKFELDPLVIARFELEWQLSRLYAKHVRSGFERDTPAGIQPGNSYFEGMRNGEGPFADMLERYYRAIAEAPHLEHSIALAVRDLLWKIATGNSETVVPRGIGGGHYHTPGLYGLPSMDDIEGQLKWARLLNAPVVGFIDYDLPDGRKSVAWYSITPEGVVHVISEEEVPSHLSFLKKTFVPEKAADAKENASSDTASKKEPNLTLIEGTGGDTPSTDKKGGLKVVPKEGTVEPTHAETPGTGVTSGHWDEPQYVKDYLGFISKYPDRTVTLWKNPKTREVVATLGETTPGDGFVAVRQYTSRGLPSPRFVTEETKRIAQARKQRAIIEFDSRSGNLRYLILEPFRVVGEEGVSNGVTLIRRGLDGQFIAAGYANPTEYASKFEQMLERVWETASEKLNAMNWEDEVGKETAPTNPSGQGPKGGEPSVLEKGSEAADDKLNKNDVENAIGKDGSTLKYGDNDTPETQPTALSAVVPTVKKSKKPAETRTDTIVHDMDELPLPVTIKDALREGKVVEFHCDPPKGKSDIKLTIVRVDPRNARAPITVIEVAVDGSTKVVISHSLQDYRKIYGFAIEPPANAIAARPYSRQAENVAPLTEKMNMKLLTPEELQELHNTVDAACRLWIMVGMDIGDPWLVIRTLNRDGRNTFSVVPQAAVDLGPEAQVIYIADGRPDGLVNTIKSNAAGQLAKSGAKGEDQKPILLVNEVKTATGEQSPATEEKNADKEVRDSKEATAEQSPATETENADKENPSEDTDTPLSGQRRVPNGPGRNEPSVLKEEAAAPRTETASWDDLVLKGPDITYPDTAQLEAAKNALKTGQTSGSMEPLAQEIVAKSRIDFSGEPVSLPGDSMRGMCVWARNQIVESLGKLARETKVPFEVYRFQSGKVFGTNWHVFTVAKFPNGQIILFDPTFSQFMSAEGIKHPYAKEQYTADILKDGAKGELFARQLAEKGWALLDQENVKMYAKALGVPESNAGIGLRIMTGEKASNILSSQEIETLLKESSGKRLSLVELEKFKDKFADSVHEMNFDQTKQYHKILLNHSGTTIGRAVTGEKMNSAGHAGSLEGEGTGVFRAKISGVSKDVAVKIYPANSALFNEDMKGALAAEKTGYGPKVYGEVDAGPGKRAFAMEIVEGGFPSAASKATPAQEAEATRWATKINRKTIQDLSDYSKKLIEEGYYYFGDLQGFVDENGNWRPIDFKGIKKLPHKTDVAEYNAAIKLHESRVRSEIDLMRALSPLRRRELDADYVSAATPARVTEAASQADAASSKIVLLEKGEMLSSAGRKGMLSNKRFGVYRGKIAIVDGAGNITAVTKDVAIKIYPERDLRFAAELNSAKAAERTTYGPHIYGEVKTATGERAFAMEIIEGGFTEPAPDATAAEIAEAKHYASRINEQTFADVDQYAARLLQEGYFIYSDAQGLVSENGRWRPIDFQCVDKLPKKGSPQYKSALRNHAEAIKDLKEELRSSKEMAELKEGTSLVNEARASEEATEEQSPATEKENADKENPSEDTDTTLSGQRRVPQNSSGKKTKRPSLSSIKLVHPDEDFPIVPKKGFSGWGKHTPDRLSLWEEPLNLERPETPAGMRDEPTIPNDLQVPQGTRTEPICDNDLPRPEDRRVGPTICRKRPIPNDAPVEPEFKLDPMLVGRFELERNLIELYKMQMRSGFKGRDLPMLLNPEQIYLENLPNSATRRFRDLLESFCHAVAQAGHIEHGIGYHPDSTLWWHFVGNRYGVRYPFGSLPAGHSHPDGDPGLPSFDDVAGAWQAASLFNVPVVRFIDYKLPNGRRGVTWYSVTPDGNLIISSSYSVTPEGFVIISPDEEIFLDWYFAYLKSGLRF